MSNNDFDEILRKQLLEEEVSYSENEWKLFESFRKKNVFKSRLLFFFRKVFYVLLIAAFTSVLTLFISQKYYGNHIIYLNENGVLKDGTKKNAVTMPGTSTLEHKKNSAQTFRQKHINENVISKNSTSTTGKESGTKKFQSEKSNHSFIRIKEKKSVWNKNQESIYKTNTSVKKHAQKTKAEVAKKPQITEKLAEKKVTGEYETENNGNIASKINDSAKVKLELIARYDKAEINQQTVSINNSEKINQVPETNVNAVGGDSIKSKAQSNIAGKNDSVLNKSYSRTKNTNNIDRMKPFYLFASANISNPIPNTLVTSSSNLGYAFGAGYRYYYKNNWSLAGEVFYSKKNDDAIIASHNYTQYFLEKETTTRILTIRSSEWFTTVIHFIYNTNNNRHSIFVGPSFSYLLMTRGSIEEIGNGKFQKLSDAPNYISGLQLYSFGAVLGYSYALTENFILRASYNKGFTDITSDQEIHKSVDYLNGVGITLIIGVK